jgi:hypothetical protein
MGITPSCPFLAATTAHAHFTSITRLHPHQADRAAAGPGPACALPAGRQIPARQTAAPAGRPRQASPPGQADSPLLRRRRRSLRLDGGDLRERTDTPLGRLAAARRAAATPDALWTALIIAPRLSTSEGAGWPWSSMTAASWGRHSGATARRLRAHRAAARGLEKRPRRADLRARERWMALDFTSGPPIGYSCEVAFAADRDVAQLGSARRSGRRGRRFKSCHPDQRKKRVFQSEGPLFCTPYPCAGPAARPRAPGIRNSPGTGSRLSRGCEALASLDVTSGRASCRR